MELQHPLFDDRPIQSEDQDEFERVKFARFIADIVHLPHGSTSVIIGLEDTWGMGKTSVINLICKKLIELEHSPILVHFNPWLVGSRDSVIESFFLELAFAIGSSDTSSELVEKATKEILNFSKFLGPIRLIPGAEPWWSIIEKSIKTINKFNVSELSLIQKKEKAQNSIIGLNRSVVVVIDDIDRLPPDEIRIVFQVIKAICDFKNVSYILAYDPIPVIKALSYNKQYDGKQFLHKIVQVTYKLPMLSFAHKKEFLLNRVKNLIENCDVIFEDDNYEIYQSAINTTSVVRAFKTPRDIIKLMNNLKIMVKNLWGEVCFADALLFETLELQYPKVSNAIKENPQKFLRVHTFDEENISQTNYDEIRDLITKEPEKEVITELLKKYSEYDGTIIRSIIEFLFPQLRTGELFLEEDARLFNRMSTKEVLTRYFHAGLTQFTYSAIDARLFIKSKNDRENIIEDLISTGLLKGWFEYVRPYLETIEIDSPEHLYIFLINLSVDKRIQINNLDGPIAYTLHTLVNAIRSESLRKDVAEKICTNTTTLKVSEIFLTELLTNHGLWIAGLYSDTRIKGVPDDTYSDLFKISDLIKLKDRWLETVRKEAAEIDLIKRYSDPLKIFFRWGQLQNDFKEVKEYINNLIVDSGIEHFLSIFPLGKAFSGIEELILDLDTIMIEIKKLGKSYQRGDELLTYLTNLKK